MGKDRPAKWCSACGELEYYGHPLPYRVKVPAYKSVLGTVPGWYALACSPQCKAKIIEDMAKDQAAAKALAAVR